MFYKKERGFTLVELLIVIIVIGILAALGLPQFGKTKEHAIGKEAIANLKLIAAAEKIYRMELNAYYPIPPGTKDNIAGDCSTLGGINDCLRVSLTEANWDYWVTGAAGTFTAYANRQDTGVSLPYRNCEYSITQSQDAPQPNSTTNCP